MTKATLRGKPDAGNPHVRFDEGEVASENPRRGSLLYKHMLTVLGFGLIGAAMADTLVPFRGNVDVAVPADATQVQTDTLVVQGASRLDKTDAGTYRVPLATLANGETPSFGVREGTLELTAGGTAPTAIAKPTTVLNKAALWLSAKGDDGNMSSKIVTTAGGDGGTAIVRWCDARETNTETPTLPYGVTQWVTSGWNYDQSTRLNKALVYAPKDDVPAVWFGTFQSGQSLNLLKADGSNAEFSAVFDVFFVYGFYDSWGYVLGNRAESSFDISNVKVTYRSLCGIDNGVNAIRFFSPLDTYSGPSKTGYVFKDGVYWDNPWSKPPKGFHLYEVKSGAYDQGVINSLFAWQNYGLHSGGDYLSEILIFQQPLTDAERAQVTRYLMEKWNLSGAPTAAKVAVAEGATAKVPVGTGALSSVDLKGEGTFVKTGDGALTVASGSSFTGDYRVESGSVHLESTEDVGVAAAAGDRITVERDLTQATVTGETLTRTDDAAADEIVKDGAAAARISSVPSGVTKLTVSAGTLSLASKGWKSPTFAAGTKPTVFNGDLEKTINPYTWSIYGAILGASDTGYGWLSQACTGSTSASQAGIWDNNKYTFVLYGFPAGGHQYLALEGDQEMVYTTVSLSVAGCYDLVFDEAARKSYDYRTMSALVGPSLDNLTELGRGERAAGIFTHVKYRFTAATAGTYYICFKTGTDASGLAGDQMVDNVVVSYVGAKRYADDVWPIPYGDFELMNTIYTARGYSRLPAYACPKVDGWTLNYTLASAGDPQAGVVSPTINQSLSAYDQRSYDRSVFRATGNEVGKHQLLLANDGNAGSAETTFRPPAGKYALVADLAGNPTQWHRTSSLSANAPITASVTIGGVTTELGVCTPTDTSLRSMTWPTNFTVNGSTDVTLKLAANTASSASLCDNLVLKRLPDTTIADADELVKDGGFEACAQEGPFKTLTSAYWTGYDNKTTQKQSYFYCCPYTYLPQSIGTTQYEGSQYALFAGAAYVEQQVTFAEAGIYRFTMQVASRPGDGYGHNGAKASFVYGGKEIEIGTAFADSVNFLEHTALFRVPAAGTYPVRIGGIVTAADTDKIVRVDAVSIKKVAAADVPTALPSVSKSTAIDVAAGAKLRLDFDGTVSVSEVKYGGRRKSGILSAETHPEFILGPGTLYARPLGFTVIFR